MHSPRLFRSLTVFALAFSLWCGDAGAAPIQPFEAIVQSTGEDVYARSGPGKEKYYPTLKLSDGQRVVVRRKDPGGWFMIDPPEGSFSWIAARHVERQGQRGTIIQKDPVVVRVGAFNSNQRDVEQVRLNFGDSIEILGEEALETVRDGKTTKETWYRIKPPPGEYRWVKGSSLVELNSDGSQKVLAPKPNADLAKSNSPNSPAIAKAGPRKGDSHTPASPVIEDDGDAPRFGQPPREQLRPNDQEADLGPEGYVGSMPRGIDNGTIRRELQSIGDQMREMRRLPETQWDLSAIEPEMLALQQASRGTSMAPLVDQKLRELRRDQLIHQNAVEFAIRDQRGPAYTRSLANRQPGPTNDADQFPQPGTSDPRLGSPVGLSSSSQNPAGPAPSSRFQGAGIVARMRNPVPDVPRYVLITPKGQLLCYLDPLPGMNLEPYVGKSMGLNGQRGFDARLKADRMRVQQLTPVRLAQ